MEASGHESQDHSHVLHDGVKELVRHGHQFNPPKREFSELIAFGEFPDLIEFREKLKEYLVCDSRAQ